MDLSANSNLTSINVSNCSQLTKLILPKGTDSKLEYLNISNTKISRIDLSDLNTSKVDLELVFDQLALTSLDITGIKLKIPIHLEKELLMFKMTCSILIFQKPIF